MADYNSRIAEVFKGLGEKNPQHVNLIHKIEDAKEDMLQEIPFEELGDLSLVKSLLISNQQIRKLSSKLGEMTSLYYINITETPLEELPEEIGNLTEMLVFSAVDIFETDFDEYLYRLSEGPRHEATFTSPAGLTRLPASFGKLKKLQTLNLEANRFTEFPLPICELRALTSLDISRNFITAVPEGIGELTNLTYLKLSRNNFHELPDSIGNLKKLERLRLDSLDLEGLPAGIGGLESLKMLEICQGRLRSIPSEIQQLKQLGDLYLIDTEIDEIDLNALKVFLPHTRIHLDLGYLDEEEDYEEDDESEDYFENT